MFRYILILVLGLLIAITTHATVKHFYSVPEEPEFPQLNYDVISESPRTPLTKNKMRSRPLPSLPVTEDMAEVQGSPYLEYSKRIDQYEQKLEAYETAIDRGDKDSVTVIIAAALLMVIIAGILYGKLQFFPESIISAAFFLFLSISAFDFSYYGNSGDVINRPIMQLIMIYIGTLITGIIGYELFAKKRSQMPQ